MEFREGRTERNRTILGPVIAFSWAVTIIALIIGIGIVVALAISGKTTSGNERSVTVAWVAATIGITATIVVVFLSIVLTSVLLRGLGRALPLFGASAVERLLGLGVTILLFRTTTGLILGYAVGFLVSTWRVIPEAFLRGITPILADPNRWDQPEFQMRMARQLLEELYTRSVAIPRSLPMRFPFADLLIGLAVWALCGQLLQTVPDQAQGTGQFRLAQLARRLSRVTWLNTLLFAIIGIALYFTTAAIVAVPTLKEFNDPAAPTIQALQSRLNDKNSPAAKAEFDADFPESYEAEDTSLKALKTYVDQREAALSATSTLSPQKKKAIEDLRSFVTAAEKSREDILTRWKAVRKSAWSQNSKLISEALANFETASNIGNGKKERLEYSQELQRWYEESWSDIRSQLQSAKDAIKNMNRELVEIATASRTALERVLSGSEENRVEGQASSAFFSNDSYLPFLSLTSSLLRIEPAFDAPSPPHPGLDLGPFGLFAGWLVDTRSLPLALIIGMLGFGLLGSAVSTFVREQRERKMGEPLVVDLAGVLIRGLSAAIIMFLAAVGGLAILGTGQSDPNPYVLFLGCLVGAVFSQEVWAWARLRMLPTSPRPGGDDERPEQPGPVGPDDPKGPPPPDRPAEPHHDPVAIPDNKEPPSHDDPYPEPQHDDPYPEPEHHNERTHLLILSPSSRRSRMSSAETLERRRLAFSLVDEGYSRVEVASIVGINVRTLYRWLVTRRNDDGGALEPRVG